jgi:hypothetical protein
MRLRYVSTFAVGVLLLALGTVLSTFAQAPAPARLDKVSIPVSCKPAGKKDLRSRWRTRRIARRAGGNPKGGSHLTP